MLGDVMMKKFERELEAMEKRIVEMAELTRSMVSMATDAVKDRAHDVSEEIARIEIQLNDMQTEIDQEAVRMMTVYGPVASNLRYLLGCTHVTSHLERMGDQVVNICESLRMMTPDSEQHPVLPSLKKMADQVTRMVDDAMDAYFERDAKKAQTTRTHDDMVDAMNDQIVKELLTDDVLRNVLSGAENIADAVAQILLARHLERIADQATNICKEVIYMVRGDYVRHLRLDVADPEDS
jgi:phosphate transport system protein